MFHSAALKLTLWYLGIIMALSICFSVVIYNISANQLSGGDRRQTYFLNDRLPQPGFNNFNQLRNQDLNEGFNNLRGNLVVFNVLVLIVGGGASYALARRTLQPIEETLEAQKRFTGDASHELRTPLTVMQTENEVTLRNPKLSKDEAVDQLKSNLEEVAKLKALSDGLLKLASLEDGNLDMKSVDLKEVVNAATDRWQKTADAHQIKLVSKLTSVRTPGDRDSLVELVSVLIDNAIKYSVDGSEVEVSLSRTGKNAILKISDHGQGIEARDLPKIFDRFYQGDQARSGASGYGLGLSIARRIVENHQGVIDVSSAPGLGSSFTVRLPAA